MYKEDLRFSDGVQVWVLRQIGISQRRDGNKIGWKYNHEDMTAFVGHLFCNISSYILCQLAQTLAVQNGHFYQKNTLVFHVPSKCLRIIASGSLKSVFLELLSNNAGNYRQILVKIE